MYHPPVGNGKLYRVTFYNRLVRAMLAENRHHQDFDDRWAEMQCQDVTANSGQDARQVITTRYRPEDGFVVAQVEEISLGPTAGPNPRAEKQNHQSGPPKVKAGLSLG